MEKLIVGLKTTRLFLNTLGYTTNISFDAALLEGFENQELNFRIYEQDNREIGQISFYDFNNKILISWQNAEAAILASFDIAIIAPHKVKGYLLFKEKDHMALEMEINSVSLEAKNRKLYASFKGEYVTKEYHIAFSIRDNSTFWLSKSWPYQKEMLKINAVFDQENLPIFKYTEIKQGPEFSVKETKIKLDKKAQVLKGLKEISAAKKKPKIWQYPWDEANPIMTMGTFMKSISPHYQEMIKDFNHNLDDLLARFLTLSLPDYTAAEFQNLFGLMPIDIKLEKSSFSINAAYATEKVLTRAKIKEKKLWKMNK